MKFGKALMGVGVALIAAGVVGLLADRPPVPTAATVVATTTTIAITTTSTAPTTTLEATTTTETVDAVDISAFVERFAVALETGDVGFLVETLHPVVVEAFGDETCETWVRREVMLLSDYRIDGNPESIGDGQVTAPTGTLAVEDMWSAPVAFTFNGEKFETQSSFAVIGGSVFWLGECE